MSLSRKLGVVLAATGAAHFVKPDLFREVTAMAFPDNTDQAIQQNGGIETAIGLGLLLPGLNKAAKLGLVGYLGWLGYNAAQAQK
ncbi:hypothetical protein [Jatrophihabitans fulvus]